MSDTATIVKEHEEGLIVLTKLFKLDTTELKSVLCSLDITDKDLINKGEIDKIITNDKPSNITIGYYGNKIFISSFGIKYKPEHGDWMPICKLNELNF